METHKGKKPMEKDNSKVLFAIDESEYSDYALNWALANLEDKLESGVILLTVVSVDYIGIFASSYGSVSTDLLMTIQDNQKKYAASLLEKAKETCRGYGVEAETLSLIGNPSDAICDTIEKFHCRLLVLGSHSRGAIERAFLGSVSNYCVHNAKCPVLVVKQKAS